MPKINYVFESGGQKNLEISWKGIWKETTVTLDGLPLGTISDKKALTAGQEFPLPDGARLKVQLVQGFTGTQLRVYRNGIPLPGSASAPETVLQTAYGMTYFIAALNLILGLVAVIFDVEILRRVGIGVGSILFAFIFAVLGFFVQRRSMLALILAILIFALDGLGGFILASAQGYTPNVSGLLARFFLLLPMLQGVGALNQLKRKETQP